MSKISVICNILPLKKLAGVPVVCALRTEYPPLYPGCDDLVSADNWWYMWYSGGIHARRRDRLGAQFDFDGYHYASLVSCKQFI